MSIFANETNFFADRVNKNRGFTLNKQPISGWFEAVLCDVSSFIRAALDALATHGAAHLTRHTTSNTQTDTHAPDNTKTWPHMGPTWESMGDEWAWALSADSTGCPYSRTV